LYRFQFKQIQFNFTMAKTTTEWYALSDGALLTWLGDYVHSVRLQNNITQQQLANKAGVNRSTIVQLEKGGGGTLLTYVKVLRALEQLPLLQVFEVKTAVSPLLLAKMEKQQRRRARSGKEAASKQTFNDW